MEHFDPLFVQQLAPLLAVNLPKALNSDVSHQLKLQLDKYNIANTIWDNSILRNRILSTKYIIKYHDNDVESFLASLAVHKSKNEAQHSILSPFNSQSDLFPNGILTNKWFQKYLKDLPFAFISVVELPENESQDQQFVDQLIRLKAEFAKANIKFTVIVISNDNCSNIEARIDSVRHLADLPRITGLLNLHFPTDNSKSLLQRDTEILVTSLLSNIKNSASSFYSSIETRIKQRSRKYYTCPSTEAIDTQITLTPNFLETRNLIKQAIITQLSNPHNLDTSLKLLEQAYELAIALLREITELLISNKSQEISDHDSKLYSQLRSLIDLIAFHIVRGYLSVEEPISALRKHLAHISNVVDVIEDIDLAPTNNWLSIQYQWVGELMELVPESILADFGLKAAKNRSKNLKCLQFFGGIFFLDSFQHDIITHPGLLFLKAAELVPLSVKNKKIAKLHYLDDYSLNYSAQLLSYQKVKLLEKAKYWISNDSVEDSEQHVSYIIYINWLIGEVYSNSEEPESIDKATEHYLLALEGINPLLDTSKRAYSWKNLIQLLSQKLLQNYERKKDFEKSLSTVVDLAFVTNSLSSLTIKSDLLSFNDEQLSKELTNSQTLFDVEALLTNANFKNSGTFVYDDIITQLKITPKINMKTLKSIVKGTDSVKLYIKDILVEYSGSSKNVHLHHNDKAEASFFTKDLTVDNSEDEETKGDLNLVFYEDGNDKIPSAQIIQFTKTVNKPGILQITSVKVNSVIELTQGTKVLTLNKHETLTWNEHQSKHHKEFYFPVTKTPTTQKDLVSTYVRTSDKLPVGIKILSLKPDITVTMKSTTLKPVIIGERVSIPFDIVYKNPKQHKVYYNQLLVSVKVKLVFDDQDSEESSDVTIRVNWDRLKDDESLSLKELVDIGGGDSLHHLNIRLNSSPQSRDNEKFKSCRLLIDLKTVVHEEGEGTEEEDADGDTQMAIYDTASYTLPIINSPFETRFVVTPRYREEGAIDMPNPFVLIEHSQDDHHEEHNKSLPIASRLWMGKLQYTDNLEKFCQGSSNDVDLEKLEIVLHQFSIKTRNPGLIVELIDQADSVTDSTITQLFTTRSKHGFSHRNITIVASVQIRWKRQGKEAMVNEYESKDWEIVLPLSDPRVLLLLAKDDTKEASNYARFRYIVENPTPRIFTFTTHLSDEDNDGSVLWDFDDDRNIVGLKQLAFPVLPFTRHEVEFFGKYTVSNDGVTSIRLPQFKVYDVNYRIWLPTLSVTDGVSVAETALYWQR